MPRKDSPELFSELRQAQEERNIPLLVSALDNPIEGATAARMLGTIGDARAVPELVHALGSAHESTRAAAAGALGEIRSPDAAEALWQSAESDSSSVVRGWAIFAYAVSAGQPAQEALVEALEDEDVEVRRGAAAGLAEVGTAEAVPAIRAARKRDKLWWGKPYRTAIRACATR